MLDDLHWVAPLLLERKEFINPRKHPFYLHGMATKFLAYRGDECLGRILVSDDPLYNQEHGTNSGCCGMFESVDDPRMWPKPCSMRRPTGSRLAGEIGFSALPTTRPITSAACSSMDSIRRSAS